MGMVNTRLFFTKQLVELILLHPAFLACPFFRHTSYFCSFLWQISLGKNIREGAHYTQFMAYDLDGDGIAEFACKKQLMEPLMEWEK